MSPHRSSLLMALCLTACTAPPIQERSSDGAPVVIPQDLYAETNGVRLHYLDWGGTGEIMLFLPGGTHTAHSFVEIAPTFTDRFRVLGMTHRGHGSSAKPETGYDRETLVQDVLGFVQAMGGGPVTLVAHSLSGYLLPDLARSLGEDP